jgi:hypothetical protein
VGKAEIFLTSEVTEIVASGSIRERKNTEKTEITEKEEVVLKK